MDVSRELHALVALLLGGEPLVPINGLDVSDNNEILSFPGDIRSRVVKSTAQLLYRQSSTKLSSLLNIKFYFVS